MPACYIGYLTLNLYEVEREKKQKYICQVADADLVLRQSSVCMAMEKGERVFYASQLSEDWQQDGSFGGQFPALGHFQGAAAQKVPQYYQEGYLPNNIQG